MFFLAVAGLVTVSLTFVLGMLVGRQWARSQPPQAHSEPAKKSDTAARRALSDAEVVQPPQIQEKLTFYQTLTAPLAATPPPPKPEPKVRDAPAKDRVKAPPEAGSSPYTVQVVAYRSRPPAEEMERKLKDAGFEAFVVAVGGEDGRMTYRVRVGSFATRAQAEAAAERLKDERRLSPFVTTR
ncbi:MAG: SPOR domain-containing protein [Candidatus Rokubacteria bacterium]|nr:SPOR domain-containing protein [Candidatus Rokubacteria bacterium]